jgi:hypothetical protein
MLKMVGGNEKGRGNTHDTYNNRTAAADGLNCWAASAERTANETLDSTTEDKNSTSQLLHHGNRLSLVLVCVDTRVDSS